MIGSRKLLQNYPWQLPKFRRQLPGGLLVTTGAGWDQSKSTSCSSEDDAQYNFRSSSYKTEAIRLVSLLIRFSFLVSFPKNAARICWRLNYTNSGKLYVIINYISDRTSATENLCTGVMESALIKTTSRFKTEAEGNPPLSSRGFLQVPVPVTSSVSTENSRLRNICKSLAIHSFPPFRLHFRGCAFHLFRVSRPFMVPILSSIGLKISSF